MRGREPRDGRRQCQVAGRHGGPVPPRAPLREQPGPARIALGPAQRQASRAPGATRQDQRAHHPRRLHNSRVQMGNSGPDPVLRVHRVRRVDIEGLARGDHDQGERRPLRVPPLARRGTRRGAPHQLGGRRRAPLADRLLRSPPGATSPGCTAPPSSASTRPTPEPESTAAIIAPTRPAPRTWTRMAPRAARRAAASPGSACRRERDARSGRSRSSACVRARNASASGPPAVAIVHHAGRRQPCDQFVHLGRWQIQGARPLVQERPGPGCRRAARGNAPSPDPPARAPPPARE